MEWEAVICTVFLCVVASAFGMGMAWFSLFDRRMREKFEDIALLADDYNRERHGAMMDAYLARRELAGLKGEVFTEDPPERPRSLFADFLKRRTGE